MPKCVELANGEKVDERIYPDLQNMFNAARKIGLNIIVTSGYRGYDLQKILWNAEVNRLKMKVLSTEKAAKNGKLFLQRPGLSEHQTGLAIDINSKNKSQKSALYRWLRNNSYKYGFILRYPEDKVDITGIAYEPWHFRYVGLKNALIIKQNNLCLEKFLDKQK